MSNRTSVTRAARAVVTAAASVALAGSALAQATRPAAPDAPDAAVGATGFAVPTAAEPAVRFGARTFPLKAVRLTGGPLREAQEVDRAYLLKLNPDAMLHYLRRNAGLKPKADHYGGWDSNGSGIYGHYLSAICAMSAATGDPELLRRVRYMVDEIDQCQRGFGDGGLYGFRGDINWFRRLREGDPIYPPIVNAWYVTHKAMAGLRDAYFLTHDEQAKMVFLRMCDWAIDVSSNVTDEQWQHVLASEHGAPQEELADAYAITGDKKYLAAAEHFTHRAIFDPLLRGDTQALDGKHANTQLQKFVGYERVYEVGGGRDFLTASANFWRSVAGERSWSTGANSQWERFFPTDHWREEIDERCGPETCNTYNALKLTKQLYELKPDAAKIDFYERAMFNSILPSQDLKRGGFVYYTSMRPGHYRTFSTDFDDFWCCVGTGMENHGKYGEMIYAHGGSRDLYVNLFVPSTLDWKEEGLKLTQETPFPDEGRSTLTLTLARPTALALKVRYPDWVEAGAMRITVNGRPVPLGGAKPGEYVTVDREWRDADTVRLTMPMRLSTEMLPGTSDYVSVRYGPIVLSAPMGTGPLTPADFKPGKNLARKVMPESDAPTMIGTRADVLAEVKSVAGEPLTFTTGALTKPGPATLVPHWRVGEQRYAIYFRLASAAEYEQIDQQRRRDQAAAKALEDRTVDQVQVGAQQSEADHHIELRDSGTGGAPPGMDHWRDAKGFFSYEVKVEPRGKQAVRCVYWGGDGGRTFDVLVDGHAIATQRLTAARPGAYFAEEYAIPAALLAGKQRVRVRFEPKPNSTAGGLFDVRVVRQAAGG